MSSDIPDATFGTTQGWSVNSFRCIKVYYVIGTADDVCSRPLESTGVAKDGKTFFSILTLIVIVPGESQNLFITTLSRIIELTLGP